MSELAVHWVSVVPDTSKLAPEVKKSFGIIGKDAPRQGRSWGAKFATAAGVAAKKAAKGGLLAVAAGFTAAGVAGARSAIQIDKSRATLTGLYGSASDAEYALKSLRKVSASSPIKYTAYLKAAESMAYMGIKGDQAATILDNVGKAIVATGGNDVQLDRVNQGLLKIVNNGRVYAADLGMISDAGVPIFSGLAAHFGTNIENVRKMVTEGKVGLEDVLSVLEKATGDTFQKQLDAGEKVTKTLANQWNLARDNVVTALGTMLEPYVAKLAPAMERAGQAIHDGIIKYGPQVLDTFGRLATTYGPALVSWLGRLGRGLLAVGNFLADHRRLVLTAVAAYSGYKTVVTLFRGYKTVTTAITAAKQAYALATYKQAAADSSLAGRAGFAAGAIKTKTVAVWASTKAMGKNLATNLKWQGLLAKQAIVTRAAAIQQWAMNSALLANPITWVVVAIAALVGALVLAYKKSERFRAIVDAAWAGIKNAVSAAWDGYIKPALTAMGNFLTGTVAPAFTSLWSDYVRPVFTAVSGFITGTVVPAIKTLWTGAIQPIFGAIGAYISLVWGGFIKPVFDAIAWTITKLVIPIIKTLWSVARAMFYLIGQWIKFWWTGMVWPILKLAAAFLRDTVGAAFYALWNYAVKPAITAIGTIISWLWSSIISPVFGWIGNRIKSVWTNLIKPVFDGWVWIFKNVVGPAISWLWSNAVKPAMDNIGGKVKSVWEGFIKPAFDNIKTGAGAVQTAFENAKKGITTAWEKLADVVQTPIRAAITFVNDKLIGNLNKILPKDYEITPIPKFETGGPVRGPGTGTSDSILAKLSNGEHVLTAADVRALGGHARVEAMRAAARSGQLQIPGFAGGGRVWPVNSRRVGRGYPGHTGVDFPMPMGSPVFAAADGVITSTPKLGRSYGWHINQQAGPFRLIYAHLSRIIAQAGQAVKAGMKIGEVGSTGNSTGPHLHFEVRPPGTQLGSHSWLMGAGAADGAPVEEEKGVLDWLKSKFDIGKILDGATSFMAGKGGIFGDAGAAALVRDIGSRIWSWISDKVGGATSLVSGMGKKLGGLLGLATSAFDDGGVATGRGWMPKNIKAPERVLGPSSTRALDEGLRNIGRIGPLDGPVEVVLSEKDKSDIAVLLGQELAAGAAKAVDRYDFVMASQARNGGGL